MGKKKKNGNKGLGGGYMAWKDGRRFANGSDKKSDKKDKKDKREKSDFDRKYPSLKTVHLSVGKKEVKEATKIISTPVDIPKKFVDIREDCNHAGDLISPADFRAMSANYAAYTPMLDAACAMFGEENVHVCAACYDVVLDYRKINQDDVRNAMITMYLACNKAVSMKRMSDKNVRKVNRLKGDLARFNDIANTVGDIDAQMSAGSKNANGGPSTMRLNDVGNNPIIN